MRFAKYHGTGNDFVMVDDVGDLRPLAPAAIAALCDRHRGVGADGLIRIVGGAAAGHPEADFFMDYANADGEAAEMCGNGIRCLAKYVFERGLTSRQQIDVWTRAGLKHLVLDTEGDTVRAVTVDMGRPSVERSAIPMAGAGDPHDPFLEQRIAVAGRGFQATAVSMGNPHCVLFLGPDDDVAAVDVAALGREVEHLPLFPNRTNVEFVSVQDGRIRLRVWERGSGETMACGTGACAALVACALSGRTGRVAEAEFPGGVLTVTWGEDDHVTLKGPAAFVFEGDVDDAWLREAAGIAVGR